MNAKKAPSEGRAKKRTFSWIRRGLLGALIAAAAALAWLRLPAPTPPKTPEPSVSLSASHTPAPAAALMLRKLLTLLPSSKSMLLYCSIVPLM